jgi:hypothetical protein
VCSFALALSAQRGARAEGAHVAAADALFRDAKAKMAAKDYVQACPKLADSYRLDPATGTLLALALCHEREGKIASAWVEYGDAALRAKKEGRIDREKAARERVAALEPKLSQLTIAAAPATSAIAGFTITRNGVALGASALGIAVPVDGGTYAIEASAPHKKPWRAKITVAASGDRQSITVPALEDDKTLPLEARPRKLPAAPNAEKVAEKPPAPAPAPATPAAPPREVSSAQHRFGWADTSAIATGVVGLGVGTAFMLQAIGKNEQSKAGCIENVCTPEARQDRLDALEAGRVATIAFAAGGALVATGLAIYLVGGATAKSEKGTASAIEAAPLPLVGGGFGGVLRGTF